MSHFILKYLAQKKVLYLCYTLKGYACDQLNNTKQVVVSYKKKVVNKRNQIYPVLQTKFV